MRKISIIIGLLVILIVTEFTFADMPTIESLDSVFLSELKFNLRRENPTNRCKKYLNGIKIKLSDESSQAELLTKVGELLRLRNSNTLANFTENCVKLLTGVDLIQTQLPKPQIQKPLKPVQKPTIESVEPIVEQQIVQPETNFGHIDGSTNKVDNHNDNIDYNEISIENTSPKVNSVTEISLQEAQKEQEALSERLKEAEEEIENLRMNLDGLNIKLMKTTRAKVDAEKEVDLLKIKLRMGCRSC